MAATSSDPGRVAEPPSRPLETAITLVLEDQSPELARAHRELYPERIPEQIPLSLTLLYPWIPAAEVTDGDVERLRSFFADRPPLEFALTRVAAFPGLVVYAVPDPDEDLRATMRALWARYPQHPPYGEEGSDPPPHCTLGRLEGDHAVTLEEVASRVEPLLPISCTVRAATLLEEYEVDRFRTRTVLPFAG
ncbi:MAG TPA: 2'-5' RNA ligase family protein [Actinomycetota bacterium]